MTIDFNCDCGQGFSFPADAAGTWLQCPKCRRLHQVAAAPRPAESPASGYVLAESATPPTPSVADLIDVFSRETLDSRGREKDLRPTVEAMRGAGDFEESYTAAPPPSVPPVLMPRPVPRLPHPSWLAIELFHYRNVIVLVFVFLFQVFGHVIGLLSFMAFAVPLVVAVGALLLAHFGCVVEETGPDGRDELPGPLRAMAWNEDLWQPFQRTAAAVLICYSPVWAILVWAPSDPVLQRLATGVAIVGSLFFPAVLLTLITSGTALNLRPDRVIGVIIVSRAYFRVMVCWAAVLVGYVGGTIAFASALADAIPLQLGRYDTIHASLLEIGLTALWLWVGVWAVHYFAWTLGLMYRESHAEFPWVYQYHVPVNRGKQGGPGEARRAAFYNRIDARLALRRFFGPM